MNTRKYSDTWGNEYTIIKFGDYYRIEQDMVYAVDTYKTLKAAKAAIDNQEVRFW